MNHLSQRQFLPWFWVAGNIPSFGGVICLIFMFILMWIHVAGRVRSVRNNSLKKVYNEESRNLNIGTSWLKLCNMWWGQLWPCISSCAMFMSTLLGIWKRRLVWGFGSCPISLRPLRKKAIRFLWIICYMCCFLI